MLCYVARILVAVIQLTNNSSFSLNTYLHAWDFFDRLRSCTFGPSRCSSILMHLGLTMPRLNKKVFVRVGYVISLVWFLFLVKDEYNCFVTKKNQNSRVFQMKVTYELLFGMRKEKLNYLAGTAATPKGPDKLVGKNEENSYSEEPHKTTKDSVRN